MSPLPRLLLSIDELAEVLLSSRAAIYRRLQRNELGIPLIYSGRKPCVRVADVEAYLEAQARESAEDAAQLRPISVRRAAPGRRAAS